jgi:5-methylcytosine-specific restriction endonuclease McrA
MPYKDKNKQKEYQRQWIADRRSTYLKDKSCVKCHSTNNLELDHIDESTKISSHIWSWSDKRRELELSKCQVLCYDCHKQKTISFITRFSNEDVLFIRAAKISHKELAEMYNTSINYIRKIRYNEKRKNV